MRSLKKIIHWYRFARRSWIAMGLGWLSVLIGLTPLIGTDEAGALLICAAIVGEVLHEKRHRLFVDQVHPGLYTWYSYREVPGNGDYAKGIEITVHQNHMGKSTVNADNWTLYKLAKAAEFHTSEESRNWDLQATMKRAETTVDYWIVFSAVVGTLLNAFT